MEKEIETEERRMRELVDSLHIVSAELKYLNSTISKFTSDTTKRIDQLTERIDRIVEKRK